MTIFTKKEITKKSENLSEWYTDIILKAKLADYAPVKGCMVIRPYGYALWEGIQKFLDNLIKEHGVENAYFPLFIPERFLDREKEHVEGFAPHLAVVTIAGGEELKERLVVRPTSETIMYEMYKSWTQSYRDLPILINQWSNVVRWEKRTYLFLRTSEFLWQEGHCAHATQEENKETVAWALDAYEKTYNELLGIYGIKGVKSETEKFAGAVQTHSFEILMPDGKALQGCTSHDLGQNFSKAFDWTVLSKTGEKLYPYQNSWGFTTRSIGGLIMVHGDDNGLVMPPQIAPTQIIIIPVVKDEGVEKYCIDLQKELHKMGLRTKIDNDEGKSAGWRFNEWELKGVPIRIEIGKREVENKNLTVVRRDTREKSFLSLSDLSHLSDLLHTIQKSLFEKHKKFTEENTHIVNSYDEFKEIMSTTKGFLKAFWCEDKACEARIKEETKATTRVLAHGEKEEAVKCIYCGKSARYRWYFAQAY